MATKPTNTKGDVVITDNRTPQQIHNDNMVELQRMLEEVQEFVNCNKEPTWGHVRMRINKHIQQDLNWIASMTGNVLNISRANEGGGSDAINPLLQNDNQEKRIMGKIVGGNSKPIDEKTLRVKPNEQEKYKSNVDSLYKAFIGMKDKDVIAVSSKPGGETLIRGVAKLAGIKDFDTCEVDVVLFADIREGIRAKAKEEETQDAVDMEMEKGEGLE